MPKLMGLRRPDRARYNTLRGGPGFLGGFGGSWSVRCLLMCAPLLCGLGWSPSASPAGQWYDEPIVTLRLGYDDNIRFTEKQEDSSFSQRLSVATGLGFRTELTDAKVKVRADLDRYSEESDLDTDNEYVDLTAKHRAGLNLFGLDGQFVRDTSRTSELETTGFVQRSKRRYSGYVNPTWLRTLNERTSVQLGYTYNKVTYEDSSTTGLLDYRYHAFQGTLFRDFDELTQLSTTATFTHYKVPGSDSKADDVGIQFGVTRSLSETLSARFAIGGRVTKSRAPDASGRKETDTNRGLLLDAGLEKKFETSSVRGRLVRELRPTGSGRLLDSKMAGLDVRHELSERWIFTLATSIYRNKVNNNSFNQGGDEQRTYFSVQPKLRWRLTRWWDIIGSYRYRYQKYDGRSSSADSNAFFVYATYNWPRESVSRWSELPY